MTAFPTLPKPCRYFPLEKGVYEVAPGLRSLKHDLGNGERDGLLFQLDEQFHRYRANKLECRAERLGKYCVHHEYSPEVSSGVNELLARQLAREHPGWFRLEERAGGGWSLSCRLTEERIELDDRFELASGGGGSGPSPAYASAFDAICGQIQEDIAVVSTDGAGRDWLSALHLCSPSHWAAEDKIGKSFVDVHAPIPGIDKINRAARSFVDSMVSKGPYMRFVWGFGTDNRLNHHPEPAPGASPAEWKGRSFNLQRQGSPFILRLERQVLWGLPRLGAAVFAIRVYFIDGAEIKADARERALLRSSLLSMTPESRVYKGLADCMDEVIAWLDDQKVSDSF